MNLPAKFQNTMPALELEVRSTLARCRCGRVPKAGFIAAPGKSLGTVNFRAIEALEIICYCGAWMQEAIDFDETMAELYPSALEKANLACYHWAMAMKYNLPLDRPADLDRLIAKARGDAGEIEFDPPGSIKLGWYPGFKIERNGMNEIETEQMIQEKGKTAPRLTPALIDAAIVGEQYHRFPGTTVTVCCLTLRNGYNTIGESAAVSAENFDEEIGRKVAREKAREKIWALEGYRLKESLYIP